MTDVSAESMVEQIEASVEPSFWKSRESLTAIYDMALARMCSPWAVLAHCAARAVTLVPPHVVLPPIIGGPGSLNWFAAIVAPSGGGKGAGSSAGRELVPNVLTRNLGSGEGMLAAYGDPDGEDFAQSMMFTADEVDTMTALGQRSGSTTMSVLRSGFSGEDLGFSYAAKDKRRNIPAHTYRMTLVISVQPERAATLLDDAGGGSPQRFMWFPGTDPRISMEPREPSGTLQLPPGPWRRTTLEIPDDAKQFIREQRVKSVRDGGGDAINGHSVFSREKFAYALAIIDGRTEMDISDWMLSGVASDVSTWTRSECEAVRQGAAERDAEGRGALRGIEQHSADISRGQQRTKAVHRVGRLLLGKLGDAGMTKTEINRAITSRDKALIEPAVDWLVDVGFAVWDTSGEHPATLHAVVLP